MGDDNHIEAEPESERSGAQERIEELDILRAQEELKKAAAEARKAAAEARGAGVRVWAEWIKAAGILLGILLGGYAVVSRAPKGDVEKTYEKTREAIGTLNGELQRQHDSTEKVRDYAEKSAEAVSSAIEKNRAAPSSSMTDSGSGPRYGCVQRENGTLVCSKVTAVPSREHVKAKLPPAPSLPPPVKALPPPASVILE